MKVSFSDLNPIYVLSKRNGNRIVIRICRFSTFHSKQFESTWFTLKRIPNVTWQIHKERPHFPSISHEKPTPINARSLIEN